MRFFRQKWLEKRMESALSWFLEAPLTFSRHFSLVKAFNAPAIRQ
jgi:hypothetical protein